MYVSGPTDISVPVLEQPACVASADITKIGFMDCIFKPSMLQYF